MTKLNLGSGQNPRAGYVNVDKFDSFSPDVVWDLEIFPWPFETGSVEEIVMNHSLEHMGETTDIFLGIIKELYRICANGAKLHITVPHPRSDLFSGDPTHVRPITQTILSLFSKKNNRRWKEIGWPNTPLATYLDVDFDVVENQLFLSPDWAKRLKDGKAPREEIDFAVSTYYNVVSEIRIVMVACK
jgi:hypothetical protein